MPKISIIMPVYNAEAFLEKSINSLTNQSCVDIEIICINDGSNDNSLKLLQNFAKKDTRIKIFNQENSGPAKARNIGLENATGQYIMFCDADDWYEPTMCEEMLKAIIKNKVDFAMCDTNIVDEVDGLERIDSIKYYTLPYKRLIQFKNYRQKEAVNVLLWSKIFKKSIIEKNNINFPENCFHDDDAFVFEYLLHSSKAYFIDKKLYNYFRREKDSIMATTYAKNSTSIDRVKIAHFVYAWLIEQDLFSKHLEAFLNFYSGQISMCYRCLKVELHKKLFSQELEFCKTMLINAIDKDKKQLLKNNTIKNILKNNRQKFELNSNIITEENISLLRKKILQKKIVNILTFNLIGGYRKSLKKLKNRLNQFLDGENCPHV